MRSLVRVIAVLVVLVFLIGLASAKGSFVCAGYGTVEVKGVHPVKSYHMGKYHDLVVELNPDGSLKRLPYFKEETNVFIWDEYPMGDPYNPDDYATTWGEPRDKSRAEMVAVVINIEGYVCDEAKFKFEWYYSNGECFYDSNWLTLPKPPEGSCYAFATAVSWVGKFPHEINKPGDYYVIVKSTYPVYSEKKIWFKVIQVKPDVLVQISDVYDKWLISYRVVLNNDVYLKLKVKNNRNEGVYVGFLVKLISPSGKTYEKRYETLSGVYVAPGKTLELPPYLLMERINEVGKWVVTVEAYDVSGAMSEYLSSDTKDFEVVVLPSAWIGVEEVAGYALAGATIATGLYLILRRFV